MKGGKIKYYKKKVINILYEILMIYDILVKYFFQIYKVKGDLKKEGFVFLAAVV